MFSFGESMFAGLSVFLSVCLSFLSACFCGFLNCLFICWGVCLLACLLFICLFLCFIHLFVCFLFIECMIYCCVFACLGVCCYLWVFAFDVNNIFSLKQKK